MRGRVHIALLGALFGALLVGCGGGGEGDATGSSAPEADARYRGEATKVGGMRLPARVSGPTVELATGDGFVPRFWPGVNLGATVPGRSPGEVAVGAEQYREWFPAMAELGVRVIRVYTLLDPGFYTELAAYNEANPAAPLYVIHGIWIPEEELLDSGDLWSPEILEEQKRLIDEVYAAASGDFEAPERLGEAFGRWTADIRPWIVAWSFGIELDPPSLRRSEARNPARGYDGRYVRTTGKTSSTEAWLARQLNYLAGLDAEEGWSRPVTFTNWLTLDPLEHPQEPLENEDLIGVDATLLEATAEWPAGLFASYHAYPYYPDFLRHEYGEEEDPYAAYLSDLRRHHRGQAVMITEFGVPSSLGSAHLGPLGRGQGDHSETEAMAIDAELLNVIADTGYAGGIVFEWIDEWFKLTWNTLDLEVPADRRQMWRNVLNNEENFGIWAAEAGLEGDVAIDGSDEEWESGQAPSQVIHEASAGIRQIRSAHDEAYLYLALRFDSEDDIDGSVIGFDVRDGGNRELPYLAEARMPEADFAIRVHEDGVELAQAAWTDALAHLYGLGFGYIDVDPVELREGSGAWRSPQMILNRPYEIPGTGETNSLELLELGEHAWLDQSEDSRSLAQRGGEVVELRIPWALLGFGDPSSRTLLVPRPDGTIDSEELEPERGLIISAFAEDGEPLAEGATYNWEPWQSVEWSQRPKQGIEKLADAFRETAQR